MLSEVDSASDPTSDPVSTYCGNLWNYQIYAIINKHGANADTICVQEDGEQRLDLPLGLAIAAGLATDAVRVFVKFRSALSAVNNTVAPTKALQQYLDMCDIVDTFEASFAT